MIVRWEVLSVAGNALKTLVEEAKLKELAYDWFGAAKAYSQASILQPGSDLSGMGDLDEIQAYALFRYSFQAADVQDFRNRLDKAIAQYEKAKEDYSNSADAEKSAKIDRCLGMIAYSNFWRNPKINEKREFVNLAWSQAKEALKGFEKTSNSGEFGRTYNQLSASASFAVYFHDSPEFRERTTREAAEFGEKSVRFLLAKDNTLELAKSYINAAYHLTSITEYLDAAGAEDQKAIDFFDRANKLSEETALLETASCFLSSGLPGIRESSEMFKILEKAIEYSKKTNDRLVSGFAYDWLAQRYYWTILDSDDSESRESAANAGLQYALKAKHEFEAFGHLIVDYGAVWSILPQTDHFALLSYCETDLLKKREWALRALETAPDTIALAKETTCLDIVISAYFELATVLTCLAKTETDSQKKTKMLEEAVGHLKEYLEITERIHPHHYLVLGAAYCYLSDAEFELASLAKETEFRIEPLRQAILRKRKACDTIARFVSFPQYQEERYYSLLGRWLVEYGQRHRQVYALSNDRSDLKEAEEAFERSAESYRKANLPSRAAESHWEAAQMSDVLQDHSKASEEFAGAADLYGEAAKGISQLQELYHDHAVYMQAWSEIERARYHHRRQEPGMSRGAYVKVSELLKSTRRWEFWATNYLAWAQVENGEDLSRKEKCEDSITAFEDAAHLFEASKSSLHANFGRIDAQDEREMASGLIRVSDFRREYCKSRIILEEARILDRKGDSSASSEKYELAAERLERMLPHLETDQDRKEIQLVAILSRAWHTMAKAETEYSPSMYDAASKLFEEAKNLSPGEKAKSLASGHSRFCKALEAGVRFADSADSSLYSIATQNLESAARFYVKAGYESASEYANASKLLFESYVYMDKAGKEEDQEKKARLCAMAEKVLATSASSYEKAEHSGKKEQVLKLLEKVRRDRELAVALTETFKAPDLVSATAAFSTPTPSQERPAGLERFEHANIQAAVIAGKKEIHVGEELGVEIELVNSGRGAAQLTKVENAIPRGFDAVVSPENYRIEDSHINMKGRKLEPLKTEDLRLVLKPTIQGIFGVKPRILYLDETGAYKVRETDGFEVSVKELGISGWLKGPSRTRQV